MPGCSVLTIVVGFIATRLILPIYKKHWLKAWWRTHLSTCLCIKSTGSNHDKEHVAVAGNEPWICARAEYCQKHNEEHIALAGNEPWICTRAEYCRTSKQLVLDWELILYYHSVVIRIIWVARIILWSDLIVTFWSLIKGFRDKIMQLRGNCYIIGYNIYNIFLYLDPF